jgi:hypothetical protein
MVKNAFALQTVQTEKESALMQNGYLQMKSLLMLITPQTQQNGFRI